MAIEFEDPHEVTLASLDWEALVEERLGPGQGVGLEGIGRGLVDHRATAPLRELSLAAKQLGEGALGTQVQLPAAGEVGDAVGGLATDGAFGIATLDIGNASEMNGFPVSSGANGPYSSSVATGNNYDIDITGECT